jgi:15-cis-phytoene synthase
MGVADLASRLTRRSGSNFYYAFLFLPRPRREALYAVYAFCRTVDDIADVEGGPGRRDALDRWRADIAACYAADGAPVHPIARQLAAAVRAYPIPREALEAIVDGVAMDLEPGGFERVDELYRYCYRVASAVGLCCIEIFGYTDPRAREYAVELGTALQLTNIIRDVGADASAGRVYLPREDLRAFDVTPESLRDGRYDERFIGLMRHQAERARRHYALAWNAFPPSDARSLVAAEIMGRIYWNLLVEIEARGFRVFGERIALSRRRKLAIALRCWAAGRLGRRTRAERAA